jgi:hypothetical protein
MITRGDAARRAGVLIFVLAFLIFLAGPGGALMAESCGPTATLLCLGNNRFQAEVAWTVPGLGSGAGQAVPLTGDTGSFWFFSSSNVELVVKVLDGRAVNRHFWVFYGGLSDVEYTLTVTDMATGARETYTNPAHRLASAADVSAFDEEAPGGAAPLPAVAPPPVSAPLRLGPELQANVTTRDNQSSPAVAVGPDGGFMVTWLGEPGVYGRFFAADGRPRGGEILLNTLATVPERPRVAADSSGRFMVVWSDQGNAVRARLFAADGQSLGGEILLAGGSRPVIGPDVTADPAGGFLAIWQEIGTFPNGPDRIHTQRFDAQGGRVGGEATFSTLGRAIYPRLVASPAGGFVTAWSVTSPTGPVVSDVLVQRLDASGQAAGAPIQVVNAGPGIVQGVAPVAYAGGGFSVIWNNGNLFSPDLNGLFAQRFAADGSPAGGVVRLRTSGSIANSVPAAVALPSGDTWALWYEGGLALDPDGGILSGVFDPAWNLRGGLARVNTYTRDYQIEPAAAAGSGGIVAAWSSGVDHPWILSPPGWGEWTQDGSFFGVFAQRFTTANCALSSGELCLGGRFRVAVQFTDPRSGTSGAGQAIPLTSDTGAFWFFDPGNVELILKVLDGRAVNGHFWVFAGALSDVAYTITVTDTQTGKGRVYHNAPHQLASRADVDAF